MEYHGGFFINLEESLIIINFNSVDPGQNQWNSIKPKKF